MSGVGFWELILLFFIGLIVLGPERLPRVANQLGTWMGQARRMTRVLKRQLEDELNLEKDLNIRPQRNPKPLPAVPPAATPRDDDHWSPAHDAASPGTGVGGTGPEPEPEAAEAEAPADAVQQDAVPGDEQAGSPAGSGSKAAGDHAT